MVWGLWPGHLFTFISRHELLFCSNEVGGDRNERKRDKYVSRLLLLCNFPLPAQEALYLFEPYKLDSFCFFFQTSELNEGEMLNWKGLLQGCWGLSPSAAALLY